MTPATIYDYIKTEEANFQSNTIRVGDNWDWNFRRHVQLIFHLKNGKFFTGENEFIRAFKNIMEPLLNLAYWTEDIDVKDVTFFIEGENGRALSFLIKKYHDEVYVREHDLDTMFDEITESDLDYGGVLVQKTNTDRPEILPLNSIAFCDQVDIMGGPIGFKHNFTPDKLRQMSKRGWGDKANGANTTIEELITLADNERSPDGVSGGSKNQVTGKTIEVYVVRGDLPEAYLNEGSTNFKDWYGQVQVVAFYTDKKNNKVGKVLYRRKDDGKNLRFHTSKKVHGRALGRGVGEMLVPNQIWTNFGEIHKMGLLEAAGKVGLVTDDPSYTEKNRIQDMENLEITTIEDGKTIQRIPTAAVENLTLISESIDEWYQHAQLTGSAFDPVLGKEATSGTTFKGQERTVAQGRGIHDRRRGQRAKFIEQLYRTFIIPRMIKEITQGKKFLATLTPEEMTWVVEQLAINYANRRMVEATFEAFDKKRDIPTNDERDALMQLFKETFTKGGNRHLLEVLENELSDVAVRMGINVAGKQKDLANLSDKLLSVFQYIFANPLGFQQAMQIPALSKSFADILEYSGMNQVDFASLLTPPDPKLLAAAQAAANPAPKQALAAPAAPAPA